MIEIDMNFFAKSVSERFAPLVRLFEKMPQPSEVGFPDFARLGPARAYGTSPGRLSWRPLSSQTKEMPPIGAFAQTRRHAGIVKVQRFAFEIP
jgi:hypothetical protein